MTQDEIIRMAREAGFHIENWSFGERASVYESGKTIDITNELKDFAERTLTNQKARYYQEGYEAGQHDEREACAKVCDDIGDSDNGYGCAAAIRARGE